MFRRSRCNVHSNMRIVRICLEDFIRAVCLVDRNSDKKKKKKELYSQRMESQYFNGKKYVFKACLLDFLLISFIESSPRVFENFRGNRGFSRQRNIDFTTVSKTFPTSPFFPFLPSFFFFTMGKIFSSSNTS